LALKKPSFTLYRPHNRDETGANAPPTGGKKLKPQIMSQPYRQNKTIKAVHPV
jgi:hypothetical protein